MFTVRSPRVDAQSCARADESGQVYLESLEPGTRRRRQTLNVVTVAVVVALSAGHLPADSCCKRRMATRKVRVRPDRLPADFLRFQTYVGGRGEA
jgi:hypothetical protein